MEKNFIQATLEIVNIYSLYRSLVAHPLLRGIILPFFHSNTTPGTWFGYYEPCHPNIRSGHVIQAWPISLAFD